MLMTNKCEKTVDQETQDENKYLRISFRLTVPSRSYVMYRSKVLLSVLYFMQKLI